MLKHIATAELKQMTDTEGLVLQGCGGDPQEWIDGMNKLLTDEGILKDGSEFTDIRIFEHEGLTNMLFNMDEVKLEVGRLAIWRLQSHDLFGSTWLSDYVTNKLGGFESEPVSVKPDCPLIGEDSNIFNLMGIASRTLKKNGMNDKAVEMCGRITSSGNYNDVLCIIGEYVNIVSVNENDEDPDYYQENEEMGGMKM